MCGIAGILDPRRETTRDDLRTQVAAMIDTLAHRGPDDQGLWIDPSVGLAFGHRRLSIIDLTADGSQPMVSAGGRFVLIFNGEIYNFLELRRRLERRYRFVGRSDTEVLLAAMTEWGVESAVERSNGMFAFAVWDREQRTLTLARDRLGEKPLYYGLVERRFVFASELDAIASVDGFDPAVDTSALAQYFQRSFVPAPSTIYRGIHKLGPGAMLTVELDDRPDLTPQRYWRLEEVAENGVAGRRVEDCTDELDELLTDAVGLRMVADVPLGAFLSGGIDSSLMTALMQRQSSDPVRTFTVAMSSASHDESAQARGVAEHIGTEHTQIDLDVHEALDLVPRLGAVHDEPFGDPSSLPTLLVSTHAREWLTVAISGDGGDEIFGGYNRYVFGDAAWRGMQRFPLGVRRVAGFAVRSVPPSTWDAAGGLVGRIPGVGSVPRNLGDKAHKLTTALLAEEGDELYERLATTWPAESEIVPGASTEFVRPPSDLDHHIDRMMLADGLITLPDDMLTKVDRTSMNVSLEVRVPFLDHRVVELAWSLPLEAKIEGGEGKRILRRLLERHLPRELIDQPKMGFDPPIGEWLRGPLRTWSEELIGGTRQATRHLIDHRVIDETWREHLSGRHNHDYRMWAVLQFLSWWEAR